MDQKKEVGDKLKRIQALWIEQRGLAGGTPEHDALLEQIRALSAEYQAALNETPRKPQDS